MNVQFDQGFINYICLVLFILLIASIDDSIPKLTSIKKWANGSTEAVSVSSLYNSSKLSEFEYRTQVLNSSVSTRSMTKPYNKHRAYTKVKPSRKLTKPSSKIMYQSIKRVSRNGQPPRTKTDNYFIKAIHGGGSFIKYLEQSEA